MSERRDKCNITNSLLGRGDRTQREHQRKSWGAWKREKNQPFTPGDWLKKKIRSSIYSLMMSDLRCKLQILYNGCFSDHVSGISD